MKTIVASLLLAIALTGTCLSTSYADDMAYISQDYSVSTKDDLAARQVISRLNHALDAADYDLYGSFFAEDGVFVSDFGNAIGPAEVSTALGQVAPFITNKRHLAGNLVINRNGKQLIVTSYLIVFERETGLEYVGSAINVDTLEKRAREWKVVKHESTLDPATQRAISAAMSRE